MKKTSARRLQRVILLTFLGLILLCLVAAGLAALSNRTLSTEPVNGDQLTSLDILRLQETLHLKAALGETIWPGWGQADIPILLFNEGYAFLAAHPDPPAGWEQIAGDDTIHRIPVPALEEAPQNFAERIGDRWVGSIATKYVADGYLVEGLRQAVPDPVEPVFPFKLAIQIMLPTDQFIAATLHESFHAYQAEAVPARFADADLASRLENDYWKADATMGTDWQVEVDLLVDALEATTASETAELASQFLAQRQARRQSHHLDGKLVGYEQRMEWLEGLAMYVEFKSWEAAAKAQDYRPLPGMDADPEFKGYATFDRHRSQQLGEMGRQATQDNVIRFYFTGMAQALLLDRLMPGWKTRIWEDDIWPENLLVEAIAE